MKFQNAVSGGGAPAYNPFSTLIIVEDFCTGDYNAGSGAVVSENAWRTIQAGSPSFTCKGSTTPSVAGHPGVLQITVAAAGTDVGSIATGSFNNNPNQFMLVGSGAWQSDIIFNIPTLSNGTNNAQFNFGFMDGPPGNSATNSIFIQYELSGSANWTYASYASSTGTTGTSGVAVTAGWHHGTILINAAGTLITYSMDGVTLGTVATNIPTAAIEFLAGYRKTLGAAAMSVGLDQIVLQQALTTAR